MPSTTRIGANRLVSRSATDASASHPYTTPPSSTSSSAPTPSSTQSTTSRASARSNFQHYDKSSTGLQSTLSRNSLSVTLLLRRYWKKLNERDSSGKRSPVAQAFAAFKMGLYFKVFITLVLVLRFVSHSSQRAYPSSSVLPEDHFLSLAANPVSPTVRIIVLTQSGYSEPLPKLLKSLADADYDRDTVAVDIWMFASSACNYVPLPLYPLAMAIFGPPRFDHSISPVFDALVWPHGPKRLVAVRTEPDLAHTWQSNRGTANETLVFVDGTIARMLSPSFYIWLKRVRSATRRGMIANAAVFSLDAITVPEGVPATDSAVILDQFFPANAAFSPSQDVWITFQKWYVLATRSWFARPSLPRSLALGGYSFLDFLRMHPTRAWFAQFLSTYSERVVYPVLHGNHSLVLRSLGSTAGAIAGSGLVSNVHLDQLAEFDENLLEDGSLNNIAVPERPMLVKANGSVLTTDEPLAMSFDQTSGRTRRATIADIVSSDVVWKYHDVLRRIGDFARSRGSESISFTMVTAAFVQTTFSWLCNVATLDIVPAAIVMIASEDKVARELIEFLSQRPRLKQGSLVISMHGAIVATDKDPNAPLLFGTSAYWLLMLQRTFLLRDLLDRGLSILQFETDQIWLSDPLPYIRHELRQERSTDGRVEDFRIPDVIVTTDTLKDVPGNFMYLRPTVGTRHLMSMVVDRFLMSYQSSRSSRAARRNRFHYIANDQSIITTLVTGRDWVYARRYPKVKISVLNRDLFVDGQWFADFEDEKGDVVKHRRHYTSETSLYPVIVNNNFLVGVEAKADRAKRFGFWFVQKEKGEDNEAEWRCDEEAVRKAAKSGSAKEFRDAPVIELGRPSQRLA